ncbi:MAG TPA: hypothetical protein VD995_01815 [Azospirillum sp.]|nr:hypothetical protein [Azospirillum sp.]
MAGYVRDLDTEGSRFRSNIGDEVRAVAERAIHYRPPLVFLWWRKGSLPDSIIATFLQNRNIGQAFYPAPRTKVALWLRHTDG